MILLVADNQLGAHAEQSFFEYLRPHHKIHFHEADFRCLIEENVAPK